jgi:hypothetical protein
MGDQKQMHMKIKLICRVFTILPLLLLFDTAHGQQTQFEQLVKSPTHEFEDWLIDQDRNRTLDLDQLSKVVCARLKNRDGLPNQTLVEILKSTSFSPAAKISFIDAILPYTNNDRYLTIDLYYIKSFCIDSELPRNDSIRQENALKMNPIIENESMRLAKILFFNYANIGERYLWTKDTLNAIDYFIKARSFPFYLLNKSEELIYFREIYIRASIGHIQVYQGNYPRLKQLHFVPSAYDGILPTYKNYIENAGGRCSICDEHLKYNSMPRGFKLLPPVEDKN